MYEQTSKAADNTDEAQNRIWDDVDSLTAASIIPIQN